MIIKKNKYYFYNMFNKISFSQSMKRTTVNKNRQLSKVGYIMTTIQIAKLVKSIFGEIDYEKSRWILY